MKDTILDFVEALRAAGLQPSVAESMDAVAAAAAAGIDREGTYTALAATLIKDVAAGPVFDEVFDRFFRAPAQRRGKTRRENASGSGSGRGHIEHGVGRRPDVQPSDRRPTSSSLRPHDHEPPTRQPSATSVQQQAGSRALAQREFRTMDALEQEHCALLAEELSLVLRARLRRRQRRDRRGRLDVRATLRSSSDYGGVPIKLVFRQRRPDPCNLVVLCDCSHSVATASRFLVALLQPCQEVFRRIRLLGFVDTAVDMSIEGGHLVTHQPLDLHARSDFGKVLVDLSKRGWPGVNRNTILLILGDARNNRRPARAEALTRLASAARRIVWLNPEGPERWNSGDSAMASYEPHCHMVIGASTPRQLLAALDRNLLR